MSNLSNWGELYEVYRATHRASVVKSLFIKKPFNEAWPYWLALLIYCAISTVSYFLGAKTSISMLFIVVTASLIYIWLEFQIAREYCDRYEVHKLKYHPFFLRTKYLSYILFAEKLSSYEFICATDVDDLIEWEDVRKEKIDTFAFFKTPVILILATTFFTITVEYFKAEKLINSKYMFVFSLVLFMVLWFGWAVSDALKSHKKKSLEICRYLKWWKLEKST